MGDLCEQSDSNVSVSAAGRRQRAAGASLIECRAVLFAFALLPTLVEFARALSQFIISAPLALHLLPSDWWLSFLPSRPLGSAPD